MNAIRTELLVREELSEVLPEAHREKKPLGRMPLRRWTSVSLWVLRFYVLVMLGLVGLKFLQMAGVTG